MTNYLADDLNFRLNLRQLDNFGWVNSEGTFDGLMGLFQNNKTELGAIGVFMRDDRLPVIDYIGDTFGIRCVCIVM